MAFGVINPFSGKGHAIFSGKSARPQSLCRKHTLDVRKVQFFPPASRVLIQVQFKIFDVPTVCKTCRARMNVLRGSLNPLSLFCQCAFFRGGFLLGGGAPLRNGVTEFLFYRIPVIIYRFNNNFLASLKAELLCCVVQANPG